MKRPLLVALFAAASLLSAPVAQAGVTVSPYVSIKSTKSIKPNAKDKSKENETVKQRREAGLRASVSFFSIMRAQLSVGQNKLTTTSKTQDAKDEYGEIDYEKDLNMSVDDPEQELKVTETQRNAKFSLILDPSFGPLILRAKVGVTGTQRILDTEVTGQEKVTLTKGPTYKPHSGYGFGIRLSPGMFFMAEYEFFHYKFPEPEPFEREVSVSFSVSI